MKVTRVAKNVRRRGLMLKRCSEGGYQLKDEIKDMLFWLLLTLVFPSMFVIAVVICLWRIG